jgi:hypothetical protein
METIAIVGAATIVAVILAHWGLFIWLKKLEARDEQT